MAIKNNDESSANSDVVAVLDENLNQVFSAAKQMQVSVRPTAMFPEHPLETGSLIVDHIIFMPIEIDLSVMVLGKDYRSVYQDIRQKFQSAEGPFTVQTKADTYENMYIIGIPHEEKPEIYDAAVMTVKMKQARIVGSTAVFVPVEEADKTTQRSGEKNSQQSPNQSLLSRLIG